MYAFAPAYVSVWRPSLPVTRRNAPQPVAGLGAVPVQIDPEARGDEGISPAVPFTIYCTQQPLPDIRRGDRLLAPDGTPYIVARVQNLYGDHLELMAVAWKLPTQTTQATWRPRYTTVGTQPLALTDAADPHAPTGIARCPVTGCYNPTLQRSGSTVCTTCYGTGWTGGYAPAAGLRVVVQDGDFSLQAQPQGPLIAVTGTLAWYDPIDAQLLPQDLLAVNALPADRFLVGGQMAQKSVLGTVYAVAAQLLPVAGDSALHQVPIAVQPS